MENDLRTFDLRKLRSPKVSDAGQSARRVPGSAYPAFTQAVHSVQLLHSSSQQHTAALQPKVSSVCVHCCCLPRELGGIIIGILYGREFNNHLILI